MGTEANIAVFTFVAEGTCRVTPDGPGGETIVADMLVSESVRGGGRGGTTTAAGSAGTTTRSAGSTRAAGATIARGSVIGGPCSRFGSDCFAIGPSECGLGGAADCGSFGCGDFGAFADETWPLETGILYFNQ